ncbi:hypothetical protein [Pseudoroseomonas sp. WGS1072]|uniref:hypothetical protein n=1 Tax=Roseomonas sp. WGS1072 TaxID=3366816 RepID=UPI003BF2FD3E
MFIMERLCSCCRIKATEIKKDAAADSHFLIGISQQLPVLYQACERSLDLAHGILPSHSTAISDGANGEILEDERITESLCAGPECGMRGLQRQLGVYLALNAASCR